SMFARENGDSRTWPPDQTSDLPKGWGEANGVAVKGTQYFLWSHARHNGADVSVMMPLSRAYLSDMIPGLGDVSLLDISSGGVPVRTSHEPAAKPLPQPYNRFDTDVPWFSTVSVLQWDNPGKKRLAVLYVHTRPSAVLSTIFNAGVDQIGDLIPGLLLAVSIMFLMVEMAALVIGVSLTLSITRAVHGLYHGTRRVMEGDFSHRIHVYGKDQLAELGTSFNSMTANLERLLAVAKEKERLQTEIEIAQHVQAQLYPKETPSLHTLKLSATCQPARMVSGDYYDYLCLPHDRVVLSIGDVAGKGISAALLMATIQSAMRMELRASQANTPATSLLVSDLNLQLHANTTPEKFATFFFAIYDENSGVLHYTNAGHLPPLLVRNGAATALHVNGTVVGAFPFAKYENDCVQLERGDLLVCYTDGITEPENEYGEEFGEARLIDVITKNADRDEQIIIRLILDAVRQWTHSGGKVVEQADDMTLLLARKF
ncbi:MAG: SpoIIE family protein phosphatase, partial [Acidobacteriaceae bacterium]|nr:SpoIIE family protein phosphatase [Acidobacteriaceae bacterium]